MTERTGLNGYNAFPVDQHKPGMALRDWFAGQALPSLIAVKPNNPLTAEQYAAMAYKLADAMLKARV